MGVMEILQDTTLSNRGRVFNTIYNSGRISKQEIANALEMSLPTVTSNLKSLEDMGLVKEDGEFESKGGRKAKAISYVKGFRYAAGLDITKNHVSIAITNLAGELIDRNRLKKIFVRSPEYFQSLGDIVNAFIEKNKIPREQVLGLGVSVPGFLNESENRILNSYPLGISNLDCRDFTDYQDYQCLFCNDANAACMAEMWNRDISHNVAYLSLSNSVGGAIMINKQLYRGENQRSAEFGHITLYPNGRPCYCGKKGCMDAYCSALVLSDHSLGINSLEDFFRKLATNDEFISDVFDHYLSNLAFSINSIRMILDCDVILGGYVGSHLEEHIPLLGKKVGVLNTFEEDAQFVHACTYKVEASAVGACLLNIEHFIETL